MPLTKLKGPDKLRKNLYPMRNPHSNGELHKMMDWIEEVLGDLSNLKMIEIGSYIGESTMEFAKRFGAVYSVDPYDMDQYKTDKYDGVPKYAHLSYVEEVFIKNTENIKNIVKVKMTSDMAAPTFSNGGVDFVYIDGLHTYEQCLADIQNYKEKIREGGVIGGHDWIFAPGVDKAVKEVFGKPTKTWEDSSWVCRL